MRRAFICDGDEVTPSGSVSRPWVPGGARRGDVPDLPDLSLFDNDARLATAESAVDAASNLDPLGSGTNN